MISNIDAYEMVYQKLGRRARDYRAGASRRGSQWDDRAGEAIVWSRRSPLQAVARMIREGRFIKPLAEEWKDRQEPDDSLKWSHCFPVGACLGELGAACG